MPAPATPHADRPEIPAEYGVAQATELVAWSHVEERLRSASEYWIATVGPSGRPRVRPISGLFIDGILYFPAVPTSRWVLDIGGNPNVSVHLDLADGDTVIIDGIATILGPNDAALAGGMAAESNRKYPQYPVTAADYAKPGHIAVRPAKALAWTDFTKDPTRFRFQ